MPAWLTWSLVAVLATGIVWWGNSLLESASERLGVASIVGSALFNILIIMRFPDW